jgi:hypothetical protein
MQSMANSKSKQTRKKMQRQIAAKARAKRRKALVKQAKRAR